MSYSDYCTWRTDPVPIRPQLSVVIPAYNEARRIVPTVGAIAAHLAGQSVAFEIVVSDDGSTDDTVRRLRDLDLRNLRVLAPGRNRGKGAAVRAGVQAARGDFVLFTDADLSTPIEELDNMFVYARAGTPVVIGSRAAGGAAEHDRSTLRSLLSAVLRTLARIVLRLPVADTQCGFKLFRADVARELFGQQTIDGFSFDLEVLWLARRAGYRIVERPVTWFDAPGSKVRPLRTTLAFLRDLVGIRLRHLGRPRRPARGLRVGLVTALPPSRTTLNEYGHHLRVALGDKPQVEETIVFCERDHPTDPTVAGETVVPTWRFDALTTPLRVLRAVRRHRPDVVLFNLHFTSFGGRRVPAALGLCTPALLRLCGVRTVVILHNLVDTVDLESAGFGSNRIVNSVLTAVGRMLTRVVLLANRVGTTMPTYVEILRERYGATNVYLAPHGAFEVVDDADSRPSDGRRRILTFGKFGTYKRLEALLAAYRQLVARPGFGDVELVIAGSDSPNAQGYVDAIRSSAADLPGVRFTGYVAEGDIPDLFRSASVVAFPYTSTTGSSGPLHQAGTYARAAVVPRVGDFLDLIAEEGFVGEPFDPDDPGTIAEALAAVLGDEDRRDRIGRQNHAAASGLPLVDIVDWHLLQAEELVAA